MVVVVGVYCCGCCCVLLLLLVVVVCCPGSKAGCCSLYRVTVRLVWCLFTYNVATIEEIRVELAEVVVVVIVERVCR